MYTYMHINIFTYIYTDKYTSSIIIHLYHARGNAFRPLRFLLYKQLSFPRHSVLSVSLYQRAEEHSLGSPAHVVAAEMCCTL